MKRRMRPRLLAALVVVGACDFTGPDRPRVTLWSCEPPFTRLALGQKFSVGCELGWDRGPVQVSSVSVESSNPAVVKVTAGHIGYDLQALAAGTATITARYEDRVDTRSITVLATGGPSIRATPSPVLMAVGGTMANDDGYGDLKYWILDGDGTQPLRRNGEITLTMNDPSIVTRTYTTSCGFSPFSNAQECTKIYYFAASKPGNTSVTVAYAGVSVDVPFTVVPATPIVIRAATSGFVMGKDTVNLFGTPYVVPDVTIQYEVGSGDAKQLWKMPSARSDTTINVAVPLAASDSVTITFTPWTAGKFDPVRYRFAAGAMPDTLRPQLVAK